MEALEQLRAMTLEELETFLTGGVGGSTRATRGHAEFLRRQTQAQLDAAEAAKATAKATEQYTRYMLWSVLLLAASVVGNLIVDMAR